MKIAVDLHIHSCLSPCSDDSMTPNNIINMAKLKGLDAIAITDHNHAGNLKSAGEIANTLGILLIPGLEVQSREEVHLLCYFEKVETAMQFGERIYKSLLPIQNKPELFGRQILMDVQDEEMGEVETLLIQSSHFNMKQICNEVRSLNGVVVPAHVNRGSNSLLTLLGFVPKEMGFDTIEVCSENLREDLVFGYRKLFSSDAHDLGKILERKFFIDVKEKTVPGILGYLKRSQ